MSSYQDRILRLQNLLIESGKAFAVFAGTDQMRYLSGWREGGHERFVGLLVPANGEPAFIVPAMNVQQAKSNPAGITQVSGWQDSTGWHKSILEVTKHWLMPDGNEILIDDEMLSVHLLNMQKLLPGSEFSSVGSTMQLLREIKGEDELDAMRKAAELIDAIYLRAIGVLKAGMTELDLSDFILRQIKDNNSSPSFAPLICFGANTARPHHHTGQASLKCGDVVIIDIGCEHEHYASDITRTVVFGKSSDSDVDKVYGIVHEAHMAAMQAAKPGVSGEIVDAAARNVINSAGYGPQFLHRTGHGIGLSCHEPPYIVEGNTMPLMPGMCFSIEPGIYLEGRFGVRIENIVTMTEQGAVSLNTAPSAMILTV